MSYNRFCRMRRPLVAALSLLVPLLALATARADDFGAVSSGNWSAESTWTPAGVPGASDNVSIGSNFPGLAATATVALTQDQSASTVTLGHDSGDSGTLNLGNYNLVVGNNLIVGNAPGSTGSILRGSGSFSAGNLYVNYGNDLAFGAADAVGYLQLANSSSLTTTSTANVTDHVDVLSGSHLTVGADMTLSGVLNLQESGSTLDMGGHKLTAASGILLGWNNRSASPTLLNRGPLTTPNLYVADQPFSLAAADSVTNLYLANVSGSTLASNTVSYLQLSDSSALTTTSTANVTSQIDVLSGSNLTLGADVSLSGQLNLQDDGSTLDMGGHKLSANRILLGANGGATSLVNRGPLVTPELHAAYQPFSLSASDAVTNFYLYDVSASTLASTTVSYLQLSNSSVLTTTSTANVSNQIDVVSGSKLTLGADLSLSGHLNLQDAGSTLDMGGHKLIADTILLAWYDRPALPTLLNRGPLIASNLYVADQPFSLAAADAVTNAYFVNVSGSTLASNTASYLQLANSSVLTTTSTANVTNQIDVLSGSKLTLGADMVLSNYFNLQDMGSTLDMGGHKLTTANEILLGWNNTAAPTTLLNRGPLTTPNLYVAGQPFSLAAADSVTNLYLANVSGSTLASNTISYLQLSDSSLLTTTSSANVTKAIDIYSGSKLTLGADMVLSGKFYVQDTGAMLDMGGHKLSVPTIQFGGYGGVPTLLNRGPLVASDLYVEDQPFSLAAPDSVTNFYLNDVSGSTLTSNTVSYLSLSNSSLLTTTSTANVINAIDIDSGSQLTLGADMVLSGQLTVQNIGSTLDMGGHKLTADQIVFGALYDTPVSVLHPGQVSTNILYVRNGSAVTLLAPTSMVDYAIIISNNSTLSFQQPGGQLTGLTFLGSSSGAMGINDTSVLRLAGGLNSGPSWVFRWQDPSAGTWESTLSGLIAAGRIAITAPAGYSVFDEEGYTYIAAPTTFAWNGGGSDNNWSSAANWGGTTPSAGHWLRFGPLAAGGHAANTNDIAGNPLFYGIFFDSQAPSYNLQGSAIQLSGEVHNQSANNQEISLNLQLVPGNGAFNTNTIAFESDAKNIAVTGSISGAGMALAKTGIGTLVLSGTNTYDGGTEVMAGTLIVTSDTALLDGSSLIVGGGGRFIFDPSAAGAPVSNSAAAVAVPEPGTLALFIAGAALAATYRKRR